jgi:hypothetical protein
VACVTCDLSSISLLAAASSYPLILSSLALYRSLLPLSSRTASSRALAYTASFSLVNSLT